MTVESSLGIAISFEIVILPILCPMRWGLEVAYSATSQRSRWIKTFAANKRN
jgi:hypothetical protein